MNKWRPPSLSELTSIIFHMELTHFGFEASKYEMWQNKIVNKNTFYYIFMNNHLEISHNFSNFNKNNKQKLIL